IVEKEIDSHLGKKFEEMAREVVSEAYPDMKIGSWWNRQGEEIDIIASGKNRVIYCEVKYTNRKVGESTLEELKRKSYLVPFSGRKEYLLISKSGFTRGLTERENLELWTLEDIWESVYV
ncbi:MAG: DUF234 domain-containing protein, partial [Thermoplasmata archaeon]|nr:DUF234 domain-containing protein [Thermoplasmata archaeon]